VYELFEEDGTPLGLFYGDFFARESKRGGAWMSNFVNQSKLLGTKPVIYNVCNYVKPAEGKPALLTYDELTTLFHEFGHALHGFFANQQYASLSGTAVARDFVEFPSQFNEHWALYPDVLKNYATFSGRARRKEYWMFFLISALISIVLTLLDILLGTYSVEYEAGLFSGLYSLLVLIPSIAVGVRRLHDTNRSGWYMLIPIYGSILILFAKSDLSFF